MGSPAVRALPLEGSDPRVRSLEAAAYTFPTDAPESDGTFSWDSTTIVVVHVRGGESVGLGYSYAPAAVVPLIRELLEERVRGASAWAIAETWQGLRGALRNAGQQGLGMRAVSAIDTALWDLKARLIGVPLADLLGVPAAGAPLYGSGGFTSYDIPRLQRQLGGWVEQGLPDVKMKVGSDPAADLRAGGRGAPGHRAGGGALRRRERGLCGAPRPGARLALR
jgi:L-alanine-DL-glutamate epimerase-like enolase superfamily enzyme